jgi:hypothetical protein
MTKSRNTYILLTIAALLFAFGYFPNAVERYYSQFAYPLISSSQRLFSGLIPFAVGDFLYALLICFAIYGTSKFILKNNKKSKDFVGFAIGSLNALLLVYIAFKLLWGLNYSRPRINKTLNIGDQVYKKEQLLRLANYFQHQLTVLDKDSASFATYNSQQLQSIATKAYKDLAIENSFFEYRFTAVKPVISPWLVSKTGIEGYYNPLSGEANINPILPYFVLPFTTCHEIAHQIGVAREDEANLVGYLTAVHSKDKLFQYSAYYNMFRYVLFEIRMKYPEEYNLIIEKIPPSVYHKFKLEKAFWAQYNGAMSVYMGKTFDKILKLNNQKKGIKSYQDIALWLVNYHKDELQKVPFTRE